MDNEEDDILKNTKDIQKHIAEDLEDKLDIEWVQIGLLSSYLEFVELCHDCGVSITFEDDNHDEENNNEE
jgi:enolase